MSISGATDGPYPMDAYAEDKKCRICGFADTKNVNIFSAGNCKALLAKILTVYPIVLYQNDPLPKNICKKCVYNVSFMYNDIQRVMKTQTKWISNVRSVQPNHNYIRVLDYIENSNCVTRESIKSTLGEDVFQHSINRLLLLSKSVQHTNQKETIAATTVTIPASGGNQTAGAGHVSSACSKATETKKCETATATKKKSPRRVPEINNIKSILELNGCTLLTVAAAKKSAPSNVKATPSESEKLLIPEESSLDDEEKDEELRVSVARFNASPATTAHSSRSGSGSVLAPPPPLTVKCRYCPLQFKSLATLATHQLIHMRLSVPKIFQKKFLGKSVRRGRLIVVQDRKCIRCLNCWRVFVDNKSILDHWSLGECDFYCHICGKEYAQAPKMLREHVPAAHGISYRSSKMQRVRWSTKVLQSMEQMPAEASGDFKLYQTVSEQEPTSSETRNHDDQQNEIVSHASTSKSKCLTDQLPAPKKSSLPASANLTTCPQDPSVFQQPSTSSSSSSTASSPSKKSKVAPIKNNDTAVSCHICQQMFNNYKARNSHMRKHKPSFAYGDVVLPPDAGIDVYMNVENDDYYARASATTHAADTSLNKIPPPLNNSKYTKISPPTNATTPPTTTATPAPKLSTVVRGVRTKFVSRRSDLKSSHASAAMVGLKVKSISDLRSGGGGGGSATHTLVRPAAVTVPLPTICTEIKEEPMDVDSQY